MGNPFFNHGATGLSNEYELFLNATDEICEIFGIDFIYLPRTLQKSDWILGEDVISKFSQTFNITLYIENDAEFEGDGDLFNKFGFSISQDMILSVQQDRLNNILGQNPIESDLIYHSASKKIFEIKKLEKENDFYQFGGGGLSDSGRMKYIFTIKLFQQSFEEFTTGDTIIDGVGEKIDINNDNEKNAFNDEQELKLNFNEADIFNSM